MHCIVFKPVYFQSLERTVKLITTELWECVVSLCVLMLQLLFTVYHLTISLYKMYPFQRWIIWACLCNSQLKTLAALSSTTKMISMNWMELPTTGTITRSGSNTLPPFYLNTCKLSCVPFRILRTEPLSGK